MQLGNIQGIEIWHRIRCRISCRVFIRGISNRSSTTSLTMLMEVTPDKINFVPILIHISNKDQFLHQTEHKLTTQCLTINKMLILDKTVIILYSNLVVSWVFSRMCNKIGKIIRLTHLKIRNQLVRSTTNKYIRNWLAIKIICITNFIRKRIYWILMSKQMGNLYIINQNTMKVELLPKYFLCHYRINLNQNNKKFQLRNPL